MSLARYTDTTATEHDADKRTIATILANDHRGKDNAIASKALAEHTNVGKSTVRDLIPEIREEYGLPIASGNGYYVAETSDEAADFIERQKRQAETSLERARSFARVWNGNQL